MPPLAAYTNSALPSVFSKCADSLENGRRLENLSWRLWNRETFCCAEQEDKTVATSSASVPAINVKPTRRESDHTYSDLPPLSESVDSVSSDCGHSSASEVTRANGISIKSTRPRLQRSNSSDRSRGREKHMTPVHLAKLMDGIREDDDIKKFRAHSLPQPQVQKLAATPVQTSAPQPVATQTPVADATHPSVTHSIVRGFSPAHISSSYRSTKSTPACGSVLEAAAVSHSPVKPAKKNMWIIGSASSDESSVIDHYPKYREQPEGGRKRTSFRDEDEVVTTPVYEDDEYTDDDLDESAIEEDDSSEWEDSNDESISSSYEQRSLFQRRDGRPELPSRRSLLSSLLHEPSRAAALVDAGQRAIRRSRNTSPQGPSVAPSPSEGSRIALNGFPVMHSKPIVMSTNAIAHPPALSPRTTRRNMLATELTESLRQNLLWERKQKDTTAQAVLKRRHTAHDMANLTEYPQANMCKETSKNNSWNHIEGLDYHVAGW